jgi:hypothetical protein
MNKKNILFKKMYDSYGTHYYGWKGVINQFVQYYKNSKVEFKETIFFDEWIEKLLLWGNKFQSDEYLNIIKSTKCKWISFLHNPPYLKWKDAEYREKVSRGMIMNEEQLNENILTKLKDKLQEKLLFLYVLSIDHKKFIYSTYPTLQDKVVSIYHPIDTEFKNLEKEFDLDLFKKSKSIFHIGWWLRNFKTFFDFQPPDGFKKNLLVKSDFMNEWENHILKHNKVEKIKIIKELSNEKYVRIFERCCIFVDLEDVVANNIILECLKFNTPFIVRYHKSIEEYVGYDYPLFFEKESDLEILSDETIFFTAIRDANEYLKRRNKMHIETLLFNKKITYDLEKLKISRPKYKLTWLCLLTDETPISSLDFIIQTFSFQKVKEDINLVFMCPSSFLLPDRNNYSNVQFLTFEDPNKFIQNLDSEFVLIVDKNDKYRVNYSELCIEYLTNKVNSDVLFSSFKKGDNNKNYQFKEKMYFIEDLYLSENNILPDSGYVFRKSLYNLLDCSFLFMQTRERYEYFIRNHLNVYCISEPPLFTNY